MVLVIMTVAYECVSMCMCSTGPAYRQGRLLPRAPLYSGASLYSGLLFEIIKYYIYL